MKQLGKIGKINAYANKKIAEMALKNEIYYCEICPVLAEMGLLKWQCLQSHSNCHRHERIQYRSQPSKLYDFKQWVFGCIPAHEYVDRNRDVKEQVFLILRGDDNIY